MKTETIRWKSAKRPPKEEGTFLCVDDWKTVYVARLFAGRWWCEDELLVEITHWAEMPKGPTK